MSSKEEKDSADTREHNMVKNVEAFGRAMLEIIVEEEASGNYMAPHAIGICQALYTARLKQLASYNEEPPEQIAEDFMRTQAKLYSAVLSGITPEIAKDLAKLPAPAVVVARSDK